MTNIYSIMNEKWPVYKVDHLEYLLKMVSKCKISGGLCSDDLKAYDLVFCAKKNELPSMMVHPDKLIRALAQDRVQGIGQWN